MKALARGLACSGLLVGASVTFGADAAPRVLVEVRIDTRYEQSDALAQGSLVASRLPPTRTTLRRGDSLSSFIVARYGLGPSDAPAAYKMIEDEIVRLNDFQNAVVARAGSILVPTLPKRALTEPNVDNPYNSLPRTVSLTAFPVADAETNAADALEIRAPWQVRDKSRKGAPYATLELTLEPRHAYRLSEDPAFWNLVNVPAQTIQVQLADAGAPTAFAMDGSLKALVTSALARTKRKAVMYVLDSGWPDKSTFDSSRASLRAIISKVREDYHLPALAWPGRSFPGSPTNSHSATIARALEPVRALDVENRVDVVFIPMSLEQGSEELRALLETHFLVDQLGPQLGQQLPDETALSVAASRAKLVLDALPGKITSNVFLSDKALLDALVNVASLYATLLKSPFIISLSWVTIDGVLKPYFPNEPAGLVVAAAGNEDRNVFSDRVAFANRTLAHRDVLAVLNMDSAGNLWCNSGSISANHLGQAEAVGFNGKVAPSGECGTSFATPRVAWFIALEEQKRCGAWDPSTWSADLYSRLLAARSGSGLAALWFDPSRFISVAACP